MAEIDLPANALVVGLARSGQAAARALVRHGVTVLAVDRNEELDAGRLRAEGVEVRLGADDPALLDGMDLLVKSPGVPAEAPIVAAARERALPVWSEVELGYRLLPNPILGVTGTNGKTTTTELLGAIFRAAGRPVEVAGNVGRPLTALDGESEPDAWVVCELSSFQLEDIDTFRAPIGVLLNVTPDHLDRHGDMGRYEAAKLRLFENQEGGDTAVVPAGYGAIPGAGARVEFSAAGALPAEPAIPGEHNRENAAAATAAARAAGIPDDGNRRRPAQFHRRPAPPRDRPRAGRRPLRERLQGDQPGGGRARAHGLPGCRAARDPGRLAKERRLLRPGPIGRRAGSQARVPDRRVGSGNRARTGRRRRPVRGVGRSRDGAARRGRTQRCRATSCCSRPRARASTSSATTRTAETASAPWWSSCEAAEDEPRVPPAPPGHARPGRLRARHGLQRELGPRRRRRGRPGLLPEAPGDLRRDRPGRACGALARELPLAPLRGRAAPPRDLRPARSPCC